MVGEIILTQDILHIQIDIINQIILEINIIIIQLSIKDKQTIYQGNSNLIDMVDIKDISHLFQILINIIGCIHIWVTLVAGMLIEIPIIEMMHFQWKHRCVDQLIDYAQNML